MAGAGGADDVLRAAGWTAAALGFAAMEIRAAKTVVLARLAWCARQLALSTLGGPAGRLAGIANVLASRVAIGEVVRELGRRLRDVAVPVVRRAIALLREAAGRLRGAADTLGTRLAGSTPRPAYAGLPGHAPALDGTRMNMGRKKDDDEGFSWLPKRNSNESHDKPGKSGQTCDYCGGSGDDPFKDGRTCPNCVGTGVNP
ncbi:hypothetical protein BKM31_37025 [[Actinomadura] parvosata subsp. kistnae]|uniref:Uncharacterized protein n=2 Tax=Nonomuraea TaxID=83681 RepID=A0A1V0A806_9ACTN|nr:hypothetical protein BKM31_37025 [Nonomuraea sp. ATCC 55076]